MPAGKRIAILSSDEFDDLYSIPSLNDKEREMLFELSEEELAVINTIVSKAAKIDYVLQLGYFRAKQYFFNFTFQKIRDDVWFIINRFFPTTLFPKKQISKHYYYNNQKKILAQYKFKQTTQAKQIELRQFAKNLAKRHVSPRFIFDELISFCQQNSLIKPAYSVMQSIVSNALKIERARVLNRLSICLHKNIRVELDQLLENEDFFINSLYLKKIQKTLAQRKCVKRWKNNNV